MQHLNLIIFPVPGQEPVYTVINLPSWMGTLLEDVFVTVSAII